MAADKPTGTHQAQTPCYRQSGRAAVHSPLARGLGCEGSHRAKKGKGRMRVPRDATFHESQPCGCQFDSYRAACSIVTPAPSFIGSWRTSLRHAPTATAAMTVAMMIAPFIIFISYAVPGSARSNERPPQKTDESAPSFSGECGTSLRQTPSATAALIASTTTTLWTNCMGHSLNHVRHSPVMAYRGACLRSRIGTLLKRFSRHADAQIPLAVA